MPFKKGQSGNPLGRSREPVYNDASLLENMRWVTKHPKSADVTEDQKDCRKWKDQDIKGFYSRLSALEEAAYKAEEAKKPAEAVPEKDADLERCIEVAREWLENEARRRGEE